MALDLWRISNHATLDGEGGRRYAARWHHAGLPIVYLAASPAGALIEVLVHLELSESQLPPTYTLLHVRVPADVPVSTLRVPGDAWQTDLALTRRLGTAWLRGRRFALVRVPSTIVPSTSNYLLNPLHPLARRVKLLGTEQAVFDPRLLRR